LDKEFSLFNRPGGIGDSNGVAGVIRQLPEPLNLVEALTVFGRLVFAEHKMSAEGADQAIMRFDRSVRLFSSRGNQSRVRRVKHGVIGAVARAFRIAGLEQKPRAGERALSLLQIG
jgi:hypothetical protein